MRRHISQAGSLPGLANTLIALRSPPNCLFEAFLSRISYGFVADLFWISLGCIGCFQNKSATRGEGNRKERRRKAKGTTTAIMPAINVAGTKNLFFSLRNRVAMV